MILTWYRHLRKRKLQAMSRHVQRAQQRKLGSPPTLEPLEDRLAPTVYTWSGTVSTYWSDPGNWRENRSPVNDPGAELVFPASGISRSVINQNFDHYADPIFSMRFDGGGYQIITSAFGSIDLRYGITTTSTGNNEISVDVNLPTFIGGTITVAGGGLLNLSGVVSGQGGPFTSSLYKDGAGVLQLSGNNTYTKDTDIAAGTLLVGRDNAIPSTSAVFLAQGATLNVSNHSDTVASLSDLAGSGGFVGLGSFFPIGVGTLTTGSDNASTTFSGAIGGVGSVTKVGTGTFTLAGRSTYLGATIINGGTLRLGSSGSIDTNGSVTVNNPGTLALPNGTAIVGSLAGNGSVVGSGNPLYAGRNNASTTFSGVISGVSDLIKEGDGTMTLLGGNRYTGWTSIQAGTLRAGGSSAIPASSHVAVFRGARFDVNNLGITIASLSGAGNVTLGSGSLNTGGDNGSWGLQGVISGSGGLVKTGTGTFTLAAASTYTGPTIISQGTLQIGAPGAGPANSTVAVAAAGTFDLNNNNARIGSLAGTGSVRLSGTLLTGGNNASTTYHGILTGIGNLVKEGTGTLTMDTVNAFTGSTLAINGGTVRQDGNYVVSGSAVVVSAGATFDLNRFAAMIGSLADAGTVTLGNGGHLITGGNNRSTSFSGSISGVQGGFVKEGTGTMTLSGLNTFSGQTTVAGGILRLGANNSLPGTSDVAINTGATLDLNNFADTVGTLTGSGRMTLGSGTLTAGTVFSSTFGGVISGTGGLTKAGLGTLTLSGNNSYTGPTRVTAGTLLVNGSQAGSDITVNSDATLGGSGTLGTISALGTISPGSSGPGIIYSGTSIFNAGSSFIVKLNGPNPGTGYDQLNALGSVNLAGNPSLGVTLGFASALGDRFVILLATGGSITGTFDGLADNATFITGGERFQIHYTPSSVFLTHIAAPADHFLISAPASSTAGSTFDFTLIALDPQNNIDTAYTGIVHFSTSDPTGGTLPIDYTFTATDNGVHSFAGGATLFSSGSQTVTATDTVSGITGTASTIITPAAADHFLINAPSSGTSGTPFDITVTALDPYGNTDTNYQGTVTFTSSDSDAAVVLPAAYPFTNSDGGVHIFTDTGLGETTLITLGDQTVTATDTVSGITGTATVTVVPGPSAPPGHSSSPKDVLFGAALSVESLSGRPTAPILGMPATPTALEAVPLNAVNVDRLFAYAKEDGRQMPSSKPQQVGQDPVQEWREDSASRDQLFS